MSSAEDIINLDSINSIDVDLSDINIMILNKLK